MFEAALSVAPLDSESMFKGSLLTVNHERLAVTATDGLRLVRVESSAETSAIVPESRVVVPWRVVSKVSRLGDGEPNGRVAISLGAEGVRLRFAGRCVHVASGGWFPAFAHILKENYSYSAVLDRRALLDAVGSRVRLIRLRIRFLAIEVAASKSGLERMKTVSADSEGARAEFSFNARHVSDALGVIPTDKAAILFDGRDPAVELRPVDSSDGLERRVMIPVVND